MTGITVPRTLRALGAEVIEYRVRVLECAAARLHVATAPRALASDRRTTVTGPAPSPGPRGSAWGHLRTRNKVGDIIASAPFRVRQQSV
jgi:hypothetical protein